jgi:hypothetical protein
VRCITSRIWISTSGVLPRNPAEPWWIMIRLFGRAKRFPLAPAASRTEPCWPPADADGADRRLEVLHRVVDGQAARHHAAGELM